jgi:hypothetical protein
LPARLSGTKLARGVMRVIRQGGRVLTLEGGRHLRLEPGAHDSPHDGVCVVELASVLAGEEFSDHPRCACEVIAGFLRTWNDRAGHVDRQRLVPYASRIIGSRAEREVTRLRRDICLSWAGARPHGGPLRRLFGRLATRIRIAAVLGICPAIYLNQGAGEYAARIAFAREDGDAGLALLDELLAVGGERGENGAAGSGHRPLDPGGLAEDALANGNAARSVNGNGAASGLRRSGRVSEPASER